MMKNYFEAEMRALIDAAHEFSQKYPGVARRLNLNSFSDRDPHVERLLEGVAFLTARLRQKLDDSLPEVAEVFLNQLAPTLIQPFPSAAVVQCEPKVGLLKQPIELKQGTLFKSSAVGASNLRCQFKTVENTPIYPLSITDCKTSSQRAGETTLSLTIRTHPNVLLNKLSALSIYLAGDYSQVLEIYFALVAKAHQATIQFSDHKTQPIRISHAINDGDSGGVKTLLPLTRDFIGFQLLQDYFAFPEKYHFILIQGLNNISWPKGWETFTITIQLAHTFPCDYQFGPQHFRLNCLPVINLYQTAIEPIALSHRSREYTLRVNSQDEVHQNISALTEVIGLDTRHNRIEFAPFTSCCHLEHDVPYYQFMRERTIVFGGFSACPALNVSCNALVNNGHLPKQYLRQHDQLYCDDLPKHIVTQLMTRPSNYYPAPPEDQLIWQLIGALSLNINSLYERDKLVTCLKLFDWSLQKNQAQRIEAIRAVSMRSVSRVSRGCLCHGIAIDLQISEQNFRSTADLFMFGEILYQFFRMYAPINTFIEMKLNATPSQQDFLWTSLKSNQMLI